MWNTVLGYLTNSMCCIKFFLKKIFFFLPTHQQKSQKVIGNDNIFFPPKATDHWSLAWRISPEPFMRSRSVGTFKIKKIMETRIFSHLLKLGVGRSKKKNEIVPKKLLLRDWTLDFLLVLLWHVVEKHNVIYRYYWPDLKEVKSVLYTHTT